MHAQKVRYCGTLESVFQIGAVFFSSFCRNQKDISTKGVLNGRRDHTFLDGLGDRRKRDACLFCDLRHSEKPRLIHFDMESAVPQDAAALPLLRQILTNLTEDELPFGIVVEPA